MEIKFKKLHEKAKLPQPALPGDAGLDLYPVSIEKIENAIICGFGFAMEIPENHVALIFPRSGIYKTDYFLTNSVGVIDSGYRGEVKAVFKKNYSVLNQFYKLDQAVAQMIIIPYPAINAVWADTLSESKRNTGGFGHTSK